MSDQNTNGDKTLSCKECRVDFIFTAGEQEFFSSKQLSPPARCKPCRQLAKERRGGPVSQQAPRPTPQEVVVPAPVVEWTTRKPKKEFSPPEGEIPKKKPPTSSKRNRPRWDDEDDY